MKQGGHPPVVTAADSRAVPGTRAQVPARAGTGEGKPVTQAFTRVTERDDGAGRFLLCGEIGWAGGIQGCPSMNCSRTSRAPGPCFLAVST